MSIDALKARLPEAFRDARLNLSTLASEQTLDEPTKWGLLFACAIATRNAEVRDAFAAEAAKGIDVVIDYLWSRPTELLLEAATVLSSWTDLDRMLQSLGDLLARSAAHSRIVLELWDEERREVEIAVSRGAEAIAKQRFGFDEISAATRQRIQFCGAPCHFKHNTASMAPAVSAMISTMKIQEPSEKNTLAAPRIAAAALMTTEAATQPRTLGAMRLAASSTL